LLTQGIVNNFILSRRQGTSQRTIEFYREKLGKAIGIPLSTDGINHFLSSLTCGNGKKNYFVSIRTLVNWLYTSGKLKSNPVSNVPMPKTAKKLLPSIKAEDIEVLMHNCCARDKVVLQLLWSSGMRLSEIVQVNKDIIDWSQQTVTVVAKGNKEVRYAFRDVDGLVKRYFASNETLGLNANGVKTMLQRLGQSTKIKCNAHAWRRGYAIEQVKRGLPTKIVQVLGNWESIAMVERYTRNLSFDDALALYRNSCIDTPSLTKH